MELNKRLQPIGSLPDLKGSITTGLQFGIENKRSAVSASRIKDLSFSQAHGGTINLGGLGNGEGVMQVLNGVGGTVITADNTGITITGGSITIKNNANQSVLDAYGIVSNSNNFINTNITAGAANQVFSGTTLTDITNGSLTFTLNRTTMIHIDFSTEVYLTENLSPLTDNCDGIVSVTIDNVPYFGLIELHSSNNALKTLSSTVLYPLTAGLHTVKLQGALQTIYMGTPSMTIQSWYINYILYGT